MISSLSSSRLLLSSLAAACTRQHATLAHRLLRAPPTLLAAASSMSDAQPPPQQQQPAASKKPRSRGGRGRRPASAAGGQQQPPGQFDGLQPLQPLPLQPVYQQPVYQQQHQQQQPAAYLPFNEQPQQPQQQRQQQQKRPLPAQPQQQQRPQPQQQQQRPFSAAPKFVGSAPLQQPPPSWAAQMEEEEAAQEYAGDVPTSLMHQSTTRFADLNIHPSTKRCVGAVSSALDGEGCIWGHLGLGGWRLGWRQQAQQGQQRRSPCMVTCMGTPGLAGLARWPHAWGVGTGSAARALARVHACMRQRTCTHACTPPSLFSQGTQETGQ